MTYKTSELLNAWIRIWDFSQTNLELMRMLHDRGLAWLTLSHYSDFSAVRHEMTGDTSSNSGTCLVARVSIFWQVLHVSSTDLQHHADTERPDREDDTRAVLWKSSSYWVFVTAKQSEWGTLTYAPQDLVMQLSWGLCITTMLTAFLEHINRYRNLYGVYQLPWSHCLVILLRDGQIIYCKGIYCLFYITYLSTGLSGVTDDVSIAAAYWSTHGISLKRGKVQ